MLEGRDGDRVAELEEEVEALRRRLDHERLYPMEWVNRRVRDRLGNAVRAGPFAGLRYPDWGMTRVDLYSAKVTGCYERELHPSIERTVAMRPPVVVNVGSAEGYYVVGLARRLPDARVVAFEISPERVEHVAEIASLNAVTVELHNTACTHEHLDELLVANALVVCDCDGCEDVLLDPVAVPALTGCTLIVEAHDLLRAGITDRLIEAFAPTHDIERVPTTQRFVDDYPILGDLPLVLRQLAISELRGGPMEWLVMTPNAVSGHPTR